MTTMLSNVLRMTLFALVTALPILGATIDLQDRQPNQALLAVFAAGDIKVGGSKVGSTFALATDEGEVVFDGSNSGISCDGKTYDISDGCLGRSRSVKCDADGDNPKSCDIDLVGGGELWTAEGNATTDVWGVTFGDNVCVIRFILDRSESCKPDSTGFNVQRQ